ncbi:hypothetical protein POM88_054370 [Heracleum sosnowskyi]|uniref:Uncharacterized protein n=1 Tax=Heracleum sosnowskyi TaxID=360622 RepID=A0AAD8GMF2_9APIA|nr:hypothetical protein POM88_054370 [Heracleum sosnowskyi]
MFADWDYERDSDEVAEDRSRPEVNVINYVLFFMVMLMPQDQRLTSSNVDGEGEGNGEEDPIKVSDADIYLATRKRDEKREYKLPEQVLKMVNDKIVDVKKTLETEEKNPELKLDSTEDSEKSANSEKSAEVSYEDDNDVNTD